MSGYFKRNGYLEEFQSLNYNHIKFQSPMILRMYGALNKVNMKRENRYILCNFLDQHSDQIDLDENIYKSNNQKTLIQLFLLAFSKAKKFNLIESLYDEYLTSIKAIDSKKEL
jgi:hypothetical protein